MIVVWLFFTMPWDYMQFVIVVFPDYTHYFWLLFFLSTVTEHIVYVCVCDCICVTVHMRLVTVK